jgi:hypothetical protein
VSEIPASWAKAWDSYLEVLGKAAEGTLVSPEFLRLQRRTLDLMCGHRDLWLKLSSEMSALPAPPASAAAPAAGTRKRARKR